METIGRIYVTDGGQVALEWIWEESISSGKTEGYVWHTGNQQSEATFATRKALAASYVAAQSLDTLYEIREMLIIKSYLSRLGSSKSEKKRVSSRENAKKGGRPLHTLHLDVKVDIWDTEYIARIYRDKIVVTCPYTKWVNNFGSLAATKYVIRDPKTIAAIIKTYEDTIADDECDLDDDAADAATWHKIGRAVGNEWLTEWADTHLAYGD